MQETSWQTYKIWKFARLQNQIVIDKNNLFISDEDDFSDPSSSWFFYVKFLPKMAKKTWHNRVFLLINGKDTRIPSLARVSDVNLR